MFHYALNMLRSTSLCVGVCVCAFVIAACGQKPDAEDSAAPATTPAPQQAAPFADARPAPAFLASFAADMPYARLREAVLNEGWLPLWDLACNQNVGAGSSACELLPETESCSGDGNCVMRFGADDGRLLRVATYGPVERWNVPGEEQALAVRSWDISGEAAPTAGAACPAGDFDGFLKRFAADEATERAFTAPLVKVARVQDTDQGYVPAYFYMRGSDYRAFILDYRDGGWYLEPVEGGRQVPTDVSVELENDGAYFVRIPGNVEGISYRFRPFEGCWRLTEDPEDIP